MRALSKGFIPSQGSTRLQDITIFISIYRKPKISISSLAETSALVRTARGSWNSNINTSGPKPSGSRSMAIWGDSIIQLKPMPGSISTQKCPGSWKQDIPITITIILQRRPIFSMIRPLLMSGNVNISGISVSGWL